jgi:ElaB/YqjD/DUF883 family membrane-anchored ribosome-binding protein
MSSYILTIMNHTSPITPQAAPSVADAVSELRHAAGDLAVATGAEAAKIKERAIENAHTLKDSATLKAEALKSAATEKVHFLREEALHQWDETRVKAKEIHVTTEDYIRQNPTKAVLGALGIGFLIGLIVRT